MTSDYLSKFTNDDGEKQTCNVEMRHLYKRIYFKPGLKGTVVILNTSYLTDSYISFTLNLESG